MHHHIENTLIITLRYWAIKFEKKGVFGLFGILLILFFL